MNRKQMVNGNLFHMNIRKKHRERKKANLQALLKRCGLSKNGLNSPSKDVKHKKGSAKNKSQIKPEGNVEGTKAGTSQISDGCARRPGRPKKIFNKEIKETSKTENMVNQDQGTSRTTEIEGEDNDIRENEKESQSSQSEDRRKDDEDKEAANVQETLPTEKISESEDQERLVRQVESVEEEAVVQTQKTTENNTKENEEEILSSQSEDSRKDDKDKQAANVQETLPTVEISESEDQERVVRQVESVEEESVVQIQKTTENNSSNLVEDLQSTLENQNFELDVSNEEVVETNESDEAPEISQNEGISVLEQVWKEIMQEKEREDEAEERVESISSDENRTKEPKLKNVKVLLSRLKDDEVLKYIHLSKSKNDAGKRKRIKRHKKSKHDKDFKEQKKSKHGKKLRKSERDEDFRTEVKLIDDKRHENINYNFRHSTINDDNRLYQENLFDSDSSVTSWENYFYSDEGPLKKIRNQSNSPIVRKRKASRKLIEESDEELAGIANDIDNNLVHFVNSKIRITCKDEFKVVNDSILFVKNHLKLVKPVVLVDRLSDSKFPKGDLPINMESESNESNGKTKTDSVRPEVVEDQSETGESRVEATNESEDFEATRKGGDFESEALNLRNKSKTGPIKLKIKYLGDRNGNLIACREKGLEARNKEDNFVGTKKTDSMKSNGSGNSSVKEKESVALRSNNKSTDFTSSYTDKTDEASSSKALDDANLLDFFPDLSDDSSDDSNPFGFPKDDSSSSKTNQLESSGDHSYCITPGKKINMRSKVLDLPNLTENDSSTLEEIMSSLSNPEVSFVDDVASNVEIVDDGDFFAPKIFDYNVKIEISKERKLLISHFKTYYDGTTETKIVEEKIDPSLEKILKSVKSKSVKPKKKPAPKNNRVYYRCTVKELDDGRRVTSLEIKKSKFKDDLQKKKSSEKEVPPELLTPEVTYSPNPNDDDLYFDFDLADFLIKKGEEDLGLNEQSAYSAMEEELFSFF